MANDLLHRFLGRHMLPDSENRPTGLAEPPLVLKIPCNVTFELRDPVFTVSPRDSLVLWTAMPETTIDEHREPMPAKNDVWPDASPVLQLDVEVLAELIPSAMQQCSNQYLRLGVGLPIRPRNRRCCFAR